MSLRNLIITFSIIASCKSLTTSSLTTPVQLKPFVHAVNRADARPSCLQGNENVKPINKNFVFSIIYQTFIPT
jgi:putative N-acetylmannosamine-6-phosphate epimerase